MAQTKVGTTDPDLLRRVAALQDNPSWGVFYSRYNPVVREILPGGRRAGPAERRGWLREAEAASRLRHPNIVTLYDVAEADDWFLLVHEYIPGGTLADRLSAPLVPRDAAGLSETIARAVHYIHQSGQLHLDLKPANILLDGEPGARWEAVTPKVSDFGIARTVEPGGTDTGQSGASGTPSYMAPEQINKSRKDMTPAADIHGLGAILYHLLTGRPPYQGATVLETIELLRRHEPLPPRRLNPRAPVDLETICLKCLEKDPVGRYPSAQSVGDDLAAWLDGRPISARPVSAVGKCWRWCRRRPGIAGLAAALVLTLLVGFAAAILLWRQAEAARSKAEANFRMAYEFLTDLIDLSVGGDGDRPRTMTLDVLISLLEKNRNGLLAISMMRPDDLAVRDRLAAVESRLCMRLMQDERHEEARTLMLGSLARLDALEQRHAMDPQGVSRTQRNHLILLAQASEQLHRFGETPICLKRVVHLSDESFRHAPSEEGFDRALTDRGALVWFLFRQGEIEQARALAAEKWRFVQVRPRELTGRHTPLQRLIAHTEFTVLNAGSTSGSTSEKERDPGALSRLRFPTDDSQPPGDWARLAAEALRSGDHRDPATGARSESEDALNFVQSCAQIVSSFRRRKDIEGARRIADRLLALAKHFVAAYPKEPAAQLTLSSAYSQIYKNAWEVDDLGAVDENMKRALDAARQAVTLDPSSDASREVVEGLERRYSGLHARP